MVSNSLSLWIPIQRLKRKANNKHLVQRTVSLLIALFVLVFPAQQLQAEQTKPLKPDNPNHSVSKLSETVSISVRHADLAEVFEMMSKHGKINILLANGVQGEVSINLYNIELHEAIKAVAIAAGFAVEKSGNTYFVVTRDDAGKEIVGGLTQVKSFKVQYSDTDSVSKILSDHLSRYGKITALPERRLIVVEDLPEFMTRIESLLEEIDTQPVQILIEAQILEIKLLQSEVYGIDWNRMFSIGGGEFSLTGLAQPSSGLFFKLTNSDVDMALSALSSKSRVRTLSSPKLLALEHQEAEVIIGDRQGYSEATAVESGAVIQNIKFLDSGVILRVTPFVDRNGKIMMEIHPEVSTGAIDRSSGIPSQTTTEVTTQLLADDGETIFIGGLIKNSGDNSRNGIPILSDIPLLGYAFRNQGDSISNIETVVMITPRIVRSNQDNVVIADKDRKQINLIDKELEKDGEKIEDVFKEHVPIGNKLRPFKF